MKVKIIVEEVGANHARIEIEDNCEAGDIGQLLKKINSELGGDPASDTSLSEVNPEVIMSKNSTPAMASEGAIRALWGAAKSNGTDINTVCREYGVDPKGISRRDCWRMTDALNKKSGYGQSQSKQRQVQSSKREALRKIPQGDGFFD